MAFLAPPGVPGCLRDLEKNCKNSQKIYKKLTCIKIPQIIALRPILGYLDYPGGPQGGQKVIWWCKNFFLAESIWSFRQNTLYLSQVSGLGGDEPWFWLCPFTTPPYCVGLFYEHHFAVLIMKDERVESSIYIIHNAQCTCKCCYFHLKK